MSTATDTDDNAEAPLPPGATRITTDNAPAPTNDDLDARALAEFDQLGRYARA